MALFQLLQRLAEKTGYDLTTQRDQLVRLANQGAKEIYETTDLPNSLMEVVVGVPANKQIALPRFIGDLRNMREVDTKLRHDLLDMRPRYNYQPWGQMWRKWRLKGITPIHTSIASESPVTLITPAVETEPPVVVITGKIATANKITDSITVDALSKTGVRPFAEIYNISCKTLRTYDITVKDINGIELAVLANNEYRTRYVLVDVSEYPFATNECGTRCMEVLYKKPYEWMTEDTDEFHADGYEDAIFYKCMSIWSADQEGKEQRALLAEQKVNGMLINKINHAEGPTQKEMTFAPNPYLGFHPNRIGWRRRPLLNE